MLDRLHYSNCKAASACRSFGNRSRGGEPSVGAGRRLGERKAGMAPNRGPPAQWALLLLRVATVFAIAARTTTADTVPTPQNLESKMPWFFGAPNSTMYIGVGDTVTWIWTDTYPHSVEGYDGAEGLFTGVGGGANIIAQKNFTYNVTFTAAGTYKYRCHKHPQVMVGTIIVKNKVNFGGIRLPFFLGISYGGLSAVVCQGDTVSWEWYDDLAHGITATDNNTSIFTGTGSNSDVVTGAGFIYKKKFTQPGTYDYRCHNHGNQMRGLITVVAKGGCFNPPPLGPPMSPSPLASTPTPPKASPPPWVSPPPEKKPSKKKKKKRVKKAVKKVQKKKKP